VAAIAGVVAFAAWFVLKPEEPRVRPEVLAGELTTTAPWPANADEVESRADAINLPAHGSNLAMHIHSNLQVFIDGQSYPVPVNLGIDQEGGYVASIHTHEASGTVHVESSTVDDFTIGDVFDIWGVRLSETCVGGYCDEGQDTLRLYRNGTEITEPVRGVILEDQSVYVLAYGTEEELPTPIPSSFDFSTIDP
jgi:hypothetical protein